MNMHGFSLERIWIPIIIFILLLSFIQPTDTDGDFYHHLNFGKYILTHHTFPHVDEYTFTARGQPIVAYAWGMDVLLYILFSKGGFVAVHTGVVILACITLALTYGYIRRIGASQSIATTTLFIITPLLASRWPTRPEIIAYPIFLLLFLLHEKSSSSRWAYVGFPICVFILSNTYASSVPMAFMLILFFAFIQIRSHAWNTRSHRLFLACTVAASAGIAFINPYGPSSIFYIQNIEKIRLSAIEWRGLIDLFSVENDLFVTLQYSILLYLLFVLFTLFLCIATRNRISPSLRTLSLCAVILPFFSFRFVPLAALFSAPFIACALKYLYNHIPRILTATLTGVIIVSWMISTWIILGRVSANESLFPKTIPTFIRSHHLKGNVWNNPVIGGFLVYYLYPDVHILMDTRDEAYIHTPVVAEYQRAVSTGSSMLPLLEKYDITIVIADQAEGNAYTSVAKSPDWALVFMDDRYDIYIKTDFAKAQNMQIFSTSDETISPAQTNQENQTLQYLKHTYATHPTFNNAMRLAQALWQRNNPTDALAVLRSAPVGFGPVSRLLNADIYLRITDIYLSTSQCQYALESLHRADTFAQYNLLFHLSRKYPFDIYKNWAYYTAICTSDTHAARDYFQKYMTLSRHSVREQILLQQEFQQHLKLNTQ